MRKESIYRLLILVIFVGSAFSQDRSLKVLDNWLIESKSDESLYRFLRSEAHQLILDRRAQRSGILTDAGWTNEIHRLQKQLMELLGPFPERTPLNVIKTGEISREKFRVEKIIFESQPGHYVTSALFLPVPLKAPSPAILFCSGHSQEAFRSDAYQQMILNLVTKGFVVLAFDPIGQGERVQYLSESAKESMIGGPTREHSYIGAQSLLGGISIARYFIWDGIRAIDYLVTRDEVDSKRIGVTGRSGGGTQAAYIAALDERVAAVAPECYITGFERLLDSIGPQDAEQNFYHGLVNGIDHADLLIARAPRPMKLIGTTGDFFSIQGLRETFDEVRRVYSILDSASEISKAEDDAPHASTKLNREAMYRFFLDVFGKEADSADASIVLLSPTELQVSPTGQVLSSFESISIFDIVRQQIGSLVNRLEVRRNKPGLYLNEVLASAKQLSGYKQPSSVKSIEAVFRGRIRREESRIEKYFIAGEGDYVLPFLLFIPSGSGPHPLILYLHPEGKESESSLGGEIEDHVARGSAVLAPDLLGIGELGGGEFKGDAYDFKIGVGDYNRWFFCTLVGRSLVGIHAGDISRLVRFAEEHPELDSGNISAVAVGALGPALLHAAAFDEVIREIRIRSSLVSFEDAAMTRIYQPRFILSTVPGALLAYDLPDLAATIAPRSLFIEKPLAANGDALSYGEAEDLFKIALESYQLKNATEEFQIVAQ